MGCNALPAETTKRFLGEILKVVDEVRSQQAGSVAEQPVQRQCVRQQ